MTDITKLPPATVVITTRNRREILRQAIDSCLVQDYPDLEILVYDDASDDGTSDMLRDEYPSVRLITSDVRKDLVVLRDCSFEETSGKYLFNLDDDAYYTDRNTIMQVVEFMETDNSIAVAAIPFLEPPRRPDDTLCDGEPVFKEQDLRSFIGCANAIRREAALKVGGYTREIIHQGEERDLCIRLLDAGYRIVLIETNPVVHVPSLVRENAEIAYLGIRNTLLFDVWRLPLHVAGVRACVDMLQMMIYRLAIGQIPARIWYIFKAACAGLRYIGLRKPVSTSAYKLYRTLPSHGAVRVPSGRLPAPADDK